MQGTRASQREWKALGVWLSRMRGASKSANCFGIDQENFSKKAVWNSSRVVTLGPKYEPLQLLLCEGVDHAGHLVLLAHVGALISYQELACPLLKPLFECHEFGLFQLSQLKFENHGWCRSCGWGGYSGGGAAAAVFFIFPRGQSSRAPPVALLERSLFHGLGGISSCRTKSQQLFLLSV